MRHKGHLLIAIAVTVTLAAPVQAATPKAGAKCTKVGSTATAGGKKFTCVKSGKKLVWNNGIATKAAPKPASTGMPTVSPTSTPQVNVEEAAFTPWSTNTTAKAVVEASQMNFRKWAAAQNSPTGSHKLVIQENVREGRKDSFQRTDAVGARLFGQYFSIPSVTVIGSTESWVVEKLNSNGGSYKTCSDNAGNQGLNYCLDAWNTQGYVVTADERYDPVNPGRDGSTLLAHEYFHLVQNQLARIENRQAIRNGDQMSSGLFPAWLIEGSANFVGFSVSSLAMGTTYWEGRTAMFSYAPPGESINSHALEDYEIRNGLGNNAPTYPYIVGQLATEYLVASVGFEKTLNIWLNFKESKDFKKSFEKAIAISLTEFYKRFEAVRTQLGLPIVSYKLVCLTSYRLGEVPTNLPTCVFPTGNPPPPGNEPPPIDRNANVEGLGCRYNEADLVNAYGTFVCTTQTDGNNRWKKKP
jgi:hypothetical protein